MMKEINTLHGRIIWFVALLTLICFGAENKAFGSDGEMPVSYSQASTTMLFKEFITGNSVPDAEHLHDKSLPLGIILSLAIPGAGEVYSGRVKWGLMFLGIEALGWTAYFRYEAKGDDIDAEFRRYADQHWDAGTYRQWIEDYKTSHGGQVPDHFTHMLPDTKTQQYYEMIGKYDQFVNWWEDYDPNTGPYGQSQRRLYYEERRHQSNVNYDRAKLAGMIIFLNHIASVIDTIIGIKKRSLIEKGWTWKLHQKRINGHNAQLIKVTYAW